MVSFVEWLAGEIADVPDRLPQDSVRVDLLGDRE